MWSEKKENVYSNFARRYESFSDLGEIRVWLRADVQSGSRVLTVSTVSTVSTVTTVTTTGTQMNENKPY